MGVLPTAPSRAGGRCCAHCVPDALPRKHSLFSLFALFPPCSAFQPFMFCEMSLFSDVQPVKMRWLVLTVNTWSQQPHHQGRAPGHFLQGKPLRTGFSSFCLFVQLHGRKCNEWGDFPGIQHTQSFWYELRSQFLLVFSLIYPKPSGGH